MITVDGNRVCVDTETLSAVVERGWMPSIVTYQTPRLGRYQGFGNLIANPPVRSHGNNRVDRKVRVAGEQLGLLGGGYL